MLALALPGPVEALVLTVVCGGVLAAIIYTIGKDRRQQRGFDVQPPDRDTGRERKD